MPDWVQLAETAALQTKDAFAQVADAVGVVLDRPGYERLTTLAQAGNYNGTVGMPRLLAMLARVLRDDTGILYERIDARPWKLQCLLVRFTEGTEVKVAVGVDRTFAAGIASAWPELKPWKKKPEDNRDRCEAWARMPKRCVLNARALDASPDSPDGTGLMAAVVANPDDDVPRLVYADWLEERGDARAQVIRKQLQLDKLPEYSDARRALEAEVKPLLEAGWKDFAGPVAKYASPQQFERGFVNAVSMTPAAFAKDGDWVFTREPVRRLWVKERNFDDADLKKIAQAPAAQHIRELSLAQVPQGKERRPLAALSSGPGYAKLQRIYLGFCGHSPEDWQRFLEGLKAPAFEQLHCHYNFGSTVMFRGFARNETFARFHTFDEYQYQSLDGAKAEGQLIDAVAELARVRSSFTTWKSGMAGFITDDVLAELYGKKSVIAMKHFELNNVPGLTDRTAETIARAPKKAQALEVFATHNSGMKHEGVQTLLRAAPNLRELRIVCFDQGVWTDDGWAALAEAVLALPKDAALKKLELRGTVSLAPDLQQRLKQRFGRWET